MAGRQSTRGFERLTPEQRSRVEAMMARRQTPEARIEEIRDREAMAGEYRETGDIATLGPPVDVEILIRFRQFVGQLREYRERSGISLATVSERSGIDPPSLSRLEDGWGNPTFATLSRYIQALGLIPKFDYEVAAR